MRDSSSTVCDTQRFQGQQPDEVIVSFFRKHWITVAPHLIGFSLVVLAVGFLAGFLPLVHEYFSRSFFNLLIILSACVVTYYLHHFFAILAQHYMTVVIITDYRLIAFSRSLFFLNEKETVDLKMIQDIAIHQDGFLQNALNYGDLKITLSSSASIVLLRSIGNPDFYFNLINQTKQAYIQRRIEQKSTSGNSDRMHGGLSTAVDSNVGDTQQLDQSHD